MPIHHYCRVSLLKPVLLLAVTGLLMGGCSVQGEEPSLTASDPQAQNSWIAHAVEARDMSAAPGLIELLDSSDPAERLVAIGALRSITGENHGYRIADPPTVRAAAADRWEAWWIERIEKADQSQPRTEADTGS